MQIISELKKYPLGSARPLYYFVLAFIVILLGYQTIYRAAWNSVKRTDLLVYRAAGEAVLNGTDIYQAHDDRGWSYVYPPTSAIFIAPLSKLPVAAMALCWYLIELAAIGGALWMCLKLLIPTPEKDDLPWLIAIPLCVLMTFLVAGIQRCQESEFMIWLIIAAIYFSFRNKPVLGGFSLAAATLIKVFPITLVIYFIVHRQWRFLMATCAGLFLLGVLLPTLVFGWQKNLDYLNEWKNLVAGPALESNLARSTETPLFQQLMNAEKPRNQSLESLFLTAKIPPSQARYFVGITGLLMLGIMAWLASKPLTAESQLTLAGAFLTWLLLIPPVSETHYFGVLLLPMCIIAKAIISNTKDQPHLRWPILGLLFLLFNLPFGTEQWELMRPLCWLSILIWIFMIRLTMRSPSVGKNEILDEAVLIN